MNTLPFPTGKFTYTTGEYSPVVNIYTGGKMNLSLNGEVVVISKFQVIGDVIEVEDVSGSYAGPEYGVGRYRWKYDGEYLTFELMEDNLLPRRKAFDLPWCEIERDNMPYYGEGNFDGKA